MPRSSLFLLLCAIAAGALPAQTPIPPAALVVIAVAGDTVVMRPSQLSALPQVELPVTFRDGSTHILQGPLLSDILEASGMPSGTSLRGPLSRTVLLISAQDGYAVTFSLAELDRALGNRRLILAWLQDGALLGEKDAPYRVASEDDGRPPRLIRQVTGLRLVQVDN